jgi:hypothetical protein
MSPKNDYQSPVLLEIGTLHELTLQGVTVQKNGSGSDVLSSLTGVQGQITSFSNCPP